MTIRGTSVTDNGIYPAFCLDAAMNESVFQNFRQNSMYTGIVETLGYRDGLAQLKEILKSGYQVFSKADWNTFMQNDLYGDPITFKYEIQGNIYEFAPTTLRYVKVLQDILGLMGTRKIEKIVEIGVGYGGQGRILLEYMNIAKYMFVDLPETLKLVEKYLSQYNITSVINLLDGTKEIEVLECDLAISNYAFSELKRNTQDIYIQKVFKHAKNGYIRWNDHAHSMYGGYSLEEMQNIFPKANIVADQTQADINNCIIMW